MEFLAGTGRSREQKRSSGQLPRFQSLNIVQETGYSPINQQRGMEQFLNLRAEARTPMLPRSRFVSVENHSMPEVKADHLPSACRETLRLTRQIKSEELRIKKLWAQFMRL